MVSLPPTPPGVVVGTDPATADRLAGPCAQPGAEPAVPPMEVVGSIDPALGPFVHSGNVVVRGGILDGSIVRVGGSITVENLIEAATIEVGGDLKASSGVVGRDRALIRVHRSFSARYLDSVRVETGHVLSFEREAINCHMTVHGSVEAPDGAIVGGSIIAARRVRIGSLGSPSAVTTTLILGSVPMLEPLLARLGDLTPELDRKRESAKRDLERLTAPGRSLRPAEKERQTELSFELHSMDQLAVRCMTAAENYRTHIQKTRSVDLTIFTVLHPGVVLAMGDLEVHIAAEVEGPIRIGADSSDGMVFGVSGEAASRPIKQLGTVRSRTAQRGRDDR